jgi:hypothetical protein
MSDKGCRSGRDNCSVSFDRLACERCISTIIKSINNLLATSSTLIVIVIGTGAADDFVAITSTGSGITSTGSSITSTGSSVSFWLQGASIAHVEFEQIFGTGDTNR